MARVNIFIGEDLLRAVDEESRRRGMNRSALFRDALEQYLAAQKKARKEAEARRRMRAACKKMDNLAEKLGDWDAVGIIRESRDSRYQGVKASKRQERGRKKS